MVIYARNNEIYFQPSTVHEATGTIYVGRWCNNIDPFSEAYIYIYNEGTGTSFIRVNFFLRNVNNRLLY